MSFSTFNLTELPDEADDDYAIEFTTKHAKVGITMSDNEAGALVNALQDARDGDMESWDGKHASEI